MPANHGMPADRTPFHEPNAGFLRGFFEQIETQVQFGDSKASLLIAGDAILLAVTGGLIEMVSGCPGNGFTVSCIVLSIPLGVAAAAAALLVISLACALVAARPARLHAKPPAQLFLLSYVASLKHDKFLEAYRNANASLDALADEALTSIHSKAVFATHKFWWLKRAVDATLLSLGFMVATPILALISRFCG
jgi:hypothetical protein